MLFIILVHRGEGKEGRIRNVESSRSFKVTISQWVTERTIQKTPITSPVDVRPIKTAYNLLHREERMEGIIRNDESGRTFKGNYSAMCHKKGNSESTSLYSLL
ncbi:hypothetical protein CEXT_405651 [Caerostris extrusa]|uniref:Uncharacterized protein n=1 Tax=Caerostris extrusa TaxID=172846 RepID=A0AAV4UIW4_CAEEX|nr:hypothetical protein CEXT_405651 [Caerostris extrusa]